jgi:vacuolar-type H+-ATPase subunit H
MTTPLDRIRSAELAAARRIEEAKESALKLIEDARARAEEEVRQAAEAGHREADRRYEAAVSRARAEADRIDFEVRNHMEQLRRAVAPQIEHLAEAMLDLVLAPPDQQGV